MRFSRQREAVMQVLSQTTSHPDAEWVYERVREKIPSISLGTVYRNLKLLANSGEILTIETNEGKVRFDARVYDHPHFICSKCGKVIDVFIDSHYGDELKKLGYELLSEKTIFYGRCNSCACEKI